MSYRGATLTQFCASLHCSRGAFLPESEPAECSAGNNPGYFRPSGLRFSMNASMPARPSSPAKLAAITPEASS
jgi:hypothetical protein